MSTGAGMGVSATGTSLGLRGTVEATSLTCFGRLSRSSQPTSNTTASTATPAAFQTRGAMGAGAGFVPHQRQDPWLSG